MSLVVSSLLLVSASVSRAVSDFDPCPPWADRANACPLMPEAELTSDGITLSGSGESPGSSGEGGREEPPVDADAPNHQASDAPDSAPPVKPTDHFGGQVNQCWNDINAAECAVEGTGTPPPVVAEPIVTWADIASFKATLPTVETEPAGWAVRGLPMNPVASASVEVISGTLLGRPAQVRFTPTVFEWSYGDGATRRSSTGGASWSALNLAELSDTSTSHAYAARGDYTLTVSVVLSAEYQFAGSTWRPIAGTLTLPGGSTTISVKTIKTVLVSEDCLRKPRGPGC